MQTAPDFKRAMDGLCDRYRSESDTHADPISIPRAYASAIDKEFISWITSHLAYGRVAPMMKAIRSLVEPFGKAPVQWLRQCDASRVRDEIRRCLEGWVWRFHTLDDMTAWIMAWKRMDESTNYLGIETMLLPQDGRSADQALSGLVSGLRASLHSSHGLRFNLPDPLKGAACKRWRLFLRWMVRSEWPDFGIWKRYPKSELIIPLDTHVHRISRQLGICDRRAQDAKAAWEITQALKKLDPKDPLKYDFAIAHLGISSDCLGKRMEKCSLCPLESVCGV